MMSTSSSSSSSSMAAAADASTQSLLKQIRNHQVSIAELSTLSSSRTVYQKNGNLYFRTSVQQATASEQKQLETATAKLQKANLTATN